MDIDVIIWYEYKYCIKYVGINVNVDGRIFDICTHVYLHISTPVCIHFVWAHMIFNHTKVSVNTHIYIYIYICRIPHICMCVYLYKNMNDIRTHDKCSQIFKTWTCKCLKEETPMPKGLTVQPQLAHLPSPFKSCQVEQFCQSCRSVAGGQRDEEVPWVYRVIGPHWTEKSYGSNQGTEMGRRWDGDGTQILTH